jgi:hypothetical protein
MVTQAWSRPVRLRRVKPSALVWSRVPLRDQVQAVRHLGVGDLLDRTAGHLRLSDLFTWITTQTGQTTDCLSEEA